MDKLFAAMCAMALLCLTSAQSGGRVSVPATRFTCQGRASGYYADVDTGCQVYHMCDGMGRQFSYSCPNTTLFQQRMLVCDHWYMVDCSDAENNYDANLLIGQRDKPFVTDEEMQFRTPRPDILSVPPNNNYYDGLKEAETKYSIYQSNNISDDDDDEAISNGNSISNDKPRFNPTGTNNVKSIPAIPKKTSNSSFNGGFNNSDNVEEVDSTKTTVTATSTHLNVPPPSKELIPPILPPKTAEASEELQIDVRMKSISDPVVKFINRFDPNSPDSLNTSMSKSEIIDLNKHLPTGQASAEDERTPQKNKNFGNNFNDVQSDRRKGTEGNSRFDSVNVKINSEDSDTDVVNSDPNAPLREMIPPKFDYTPIASTTMGPPIYFEWKWAVPAFELEPPKFDNTTTINTTQNIEATKKPGKKPFNRPRTTTEEPDLFKRTINVEYNMSSYFVPDYVFPLDGAHPGYEGDDAQTSFQVDVSRPGRSSYGENPNCPQCHPAYLNPGSCEPCIVKR